jgi:DNA-directed RNA polymerase
MTYVYSATRYGVQDMILQTLRELDEGEPYLGGADNYEAANYLSYIMFEAIAEVVSAATTAMEWLRSVAKVASDAGVR